MITPIIKRIVMCEGESPVLMSRVETARGTPATQATFGTITWKIFDVRDRTSVDPETAIASGSLTVSSVFYNTLQTDSDWDEDTTGYNFRWQPAASYFTNSSTGPGKLRIEVYGTPASGQPFWVGRWLVELYDMLTV